MLRVFFLLCLSVILVSGCDRSDHRDLQVPQFVSRHQDNFVLTNGQASMTVSPARGGRVMSLKYDQFEFLATETKINNQPNAYGTVLWSSPQTEWSWPPLPELDHQAYTVSCDHDKTAIVLSSSIEPKTGYQFVKSYMLGDKPQTFKIRYKIINHSKQTKAVAAIENTRIRPDGLAFFPIGDTEPSSGLFYPLDVQVTDSVLWHKFAPEKIRQDNHKVMADGREGWLAYSKGQYLFVQRFADSPADKAPETEREVEIFGHSDRTFAELKHQSALHQLAPGESFEYEVEWQVKKLPAEVESVIGNQQLVEAARALD